MKKLVSLILIILILTLTLNVNAADERNLKFNSNKTEINKGEEIVLTISSTELTGIEANLEYDKSVWTLENKTSEYSFTLNESTGKFVLTNITGEGKISVDITLKSKENTTVDSSTIKINDIVGSDETGGEYSTFDKKEVTINFKTAQTSNPPVNNQKPTETVQQQPNVVKNDVPEKNIPYTGVEDVFTVIIIVSVLSAIFYIEYKKNNY